MTAALITTALSDGLQPVDPPRHLGGIADLIELCFSHELDAGGRGLIRELKWLSHTGPALGVLQWALLGQQPWNLGYVWVEGGRVVGTVSTQRAAPRAPSWIVANVAVHPDYRRRGIAAALMQATLELIARQGGSEAILQVDDDNLGAVALYRGLGFGRVTTQTTWVRPAYSAPPDFTGTPFDIRLRGPREWADQQALAALARPAGLIWGQPPRPSDFRPGLRRNLDNFFAGRYEAHWVVRDPLPRGAGSPRLAGSLSLSVGGPDGDRLTLLVHPAYAGQLEGPLLTRALRQLGRRPWSARVDYPTDIDEAAPAFVALGFQSRRVLRWMKYPLGAPESRAG
ncbi:MAG: GNAT family N-acetyltransferase [Anaerolineales bacterium]|nr:GNAT family N-acetyltransferase [Anaerolineales bacterium]